SIDFQRNKFKSVLTLKQTEDVFDVKLLYEDYENKCIQIAEKFEARKWITDASKNASSVNFATHVIKLTHSKIDSSSFYDKIDSQSLKFLTTSSLKETKVDGAVSGNQYAPVYQFLELELNGNKMSSVFADEENEILKPFTNSHEELKQWNKGFRKSLAADGVSSHSLAKQVFFPIEEDELQYHLLCPVKSSSLAQSIYEKTFDDEQKNIKKSQDKNKYSKSTSALFWNKATISVTASNHSNASQLNGKRGGKLILYSCAPPDWQSQLKLPIHSVSFLYSVHLQKSSRTTLDYLRDFLIRHQRLGLSIKDPKNLKWLDKWTGEIIDEVLGYAANIQNLQPGWSSTDDIKLKLEHQYFLDPYRNNDVFQTARKASDWHTVICKDFAQWLNRLLIGKDKQFTPQREHRRLWMAFMDQPLRDYIQTIEQNFKAQAREQS
ncbi:type I-F CRISPR-associated protein Csy1, partial [Methylomonas rivi]